MFVKASCCFQPCGLCSLSQNESAENSFDRSNMSMESPDNSLVIDFEGTYDAVAKCSLPTLVPDTANFRMVHDF